MFMLSGANAVYSNNTWKVQAIIARRARKYRSIFEAQLFDFEDCATKALNWRSPAEVFKRIRSGD